MGRVFPLGTFDEQLLHAARDPRVAAVLSAPEHAARESLSLQRALRAAVPAELARAAAELHDLRRRAAGRLFAPERLALTQKGLAQASSQAVAAARAQRVARHGAGAVVWDATAGLGLDSVGLARAGLGLVSSDKDPLLARFAAHNLAALGLAARVLAADALGGAVRADLWVLDPDRRAGGERSLDPAQWSPSFAALAARLSSVEGAAIKLAPAVDLEALGPHLPRGLAHRWSFLGHAGELAEVCLWTGCLAEGGDGQREAVLLDPEGGAAVFAAENLDQEPALDPESARSVTWIAEPAAPLLRSALAGALARSLGAAPLGPRLGFLGLWSEPPPSPFYRAFRVLAEAPADRRRVRAMLQDHGIGPIRVRARGHPDPEAALERQWAGTGKRRGFLLVARLEQGHRAYLVEPRRPASAPAILPSAAPI